MIYIYQVDDTPEDHSTSHKISHKNPDVEIIHQTHRDNLDNIYMFVLISTIYMVATNPKHLAAKCSFIGFTISQFIVTIGYFTKVIGFRDMYPIIINTLIRVKSSTFVEIYLKITFQFHLCFVHTRLVMFQIQYFRKLMGVISWIVNVYMVACIIRTAI